ncbi:MAG: DUF3330 domain-containing protein [Gammaproteobacteria bacterium]|nr:DUF3330 domain-containing protein [Gammaproteobacteria bacterium]MDH3446707.1 DUF3330 domain-containing protein [Gammaproteobacteria bacterium]
MLNYRLLPGINETGEKKTDNDFLVMAKEIVVIPEKTDPEEPEYVTCDNCLNEVPIDEAGSFEATDYLVHCCGLEGFEKWKQKNQHQQ